MDVPDADPPLLPSPFADLGGTDDEALETHICTFASRIAAAMCLFLLAIAEYDRRQAWQRWECRSMVHWLSWRCAISPNVAGQYCRTATALAALPELTARFATGELSYSQVRAICRVATPDTETMLIDLARVMTAAQLEKTVSTYRQVKAVAEQTATERDRRRTLTWGYDDDGSITGVFRMPPEDAAVFIKAIQHRTINLDPTSADHDGHPLDPAGARRLDALIDLAAADLDRQAAHDSADPGDRYLVTIIADAATLKADPHPSDVIDIDTIEAEQANPAEQARPTQPDRQPRTNDGSGTADAVSGESHPQDSEQTDEAGPANHRAPKDEQPSERAGQPPLCEVAGRAGLAPSTIRRLLCDQPHVTITTDPTGHILDIGRRTRRINRGLRRALHHRDQQCRFPGCSATIVDAHHIDHWIDGGPTRLTNLISLCRRHHRRHHQGGFTIEAGPDNQLVFTLANGQHLTTTPPPTPIPPGGALDDTPHPDACTPQWDGTPLSLYALDTIMTGLLQADGLLSQDERPDPDALGTRPDDRGKGTI